jgi:hypothetical protein
VQIKKSLYSLKKSPVVSINGSSKLRRPCSSEQFICGSADGSANRATKQLNETTVMNAIKTLACTSLAVLLTVPASQAQSTYSSAIINLNPTAYWPMHETEPAAPGPIETNEGTLGSIANAYFGTWENSSGGITNQITGVRRCESGLFAHPLDIAASVHEASIHG